MLKFSRYILLAILFAASLPLMSQEEDETIITNQIWIDYYAYYYFKPKWEFYGDAGYRFIPKNFAWQMFHLRPSIRYIAPALWEVHGGVGFFQTFYKDEYNTFEIRPWQGAKIKWPSFDPVYFSHYVRLEERLFIPEESSLKFDIRFRYKLGTKINVYRFQNKNQIFILGYAEAFVDLESKIQEVFRNRARFSAGIGYRTHKDWTFEFNFVGQHGRSGQDEEFVTAERLYQFKVRRHLFKKEYRETRTTDYY
jgi:hypothetical protein